MISILLFVVFFIHSKALVRSHDIDFLSGYVSPNVNQHLSTVINDERIINRSFYPRERMIALSAHRVAVRPSMEAIRQKILLALIIRALLQRLNQQERDTNHFWKKSKNFHRSIEEYLPNTTMILSCVLICMILLLTTYS